MMVTIMSPVAKNEALVLSDSGSTICFVVKSFMDKIGIAPQEKFKFYWAKMLQIYY